MASDPNAFDDFFDDEEPEEVVDTKADGRLLRVPLARISPNLVNPRTEFGNQDQLEDLGRSLKRRQIQAVPVVTRKAYLKLWPDHQDQIGSVDVVIVSGERRYRGAKAVDLAALECVINDDLAESHKTFMDAVVSENIDRQNFDPVEEAYAVQALVDVFGTARAVAQHYERGDGWVSQRRVLLELAPGVQDLVRRRDMPLEYARKLGKLTKDNSWGEAEQLGWWTQENSSRKAAAEEKKAAKVPRGRQAAASGQPSQDRASFTAVKTHASGSGDPEGNETLQNSVATASGTQSQVPPATAREQLGTGTSDGAEETVRASDADDDVPPQRAKDLPAVDPSPGKPVFKMPWDNGEAVADWAIVKMPQEQLDRLRDRLVKHSPPPAGHSGAVLAADVLPWGDEAALANMLLERVDREKIPALIDALMEGR